MTTDAQAALAAAALIVSSQRFPATFSEREAYTLQMAKSFLYWLKAWPADPGVERGTDDNRFDRLTGLSDRISRAVPPFGERIRSAHHYQSTANPIFCSCGLGWPCNGHVLDPSILTPSGCRACVCGEKWPCSQRPVDQPAQSMAPTEALDLTGLRQHLRDAESEERGGR